MIDRIEVRIKAFRRAHKVSQAYMADILGVSQPAYSMIENGKREVTPDLMEKLVNNGVFPPDELSLPTLIKEQSEMMTTNDQEMLFQIAQRMVR